MVFNVMHNQTANGYVYNATSEQEKALYEARITQLEEDNKYLKALVDKLLKKLDL